MLGGIEIPSDKGLSGWSDADVLTHAVMDALLGAAGLGDIGQHFPPGEPRYRNINSILLLKRVRSKLKDAGWRASNIDATIVAESPRLNSFFEQMKQRMSSALFIQPDQVNVKATTSEGLGYVGRGEGVAVYAVALIEQMTE